MVFDTKYLRRAALPLACLFSLASLVFAQSDRGAISGRVFDASGAAIPGAKVIITNTSNNSTFTSESNESGAFSAPSLPVGEYSIRAEREGFKPAVLSGLTVNASSTIRGDITMEIGSSVQAVEIRADAILLQNDSAKSSTTITQKLVDQLPLVVGGALRSPFDLAALTPEAKSFGDRFSIGGGQNSSYGVTLDGVSAATTRALQTSWISYNAPSLEAVTEFTVDTNGFKAEFGHAAGGSIAFASKSGSNEYHGTAYEFLRNDALDARRFFEAKRGIYKQHDFGASFGGPIWIPKVYNGKNKTFFFISYEGFRNRVGASSALRSVPTPEMYSGDFSKWVNAAGVLIPVYDPATTGPDSSGKLVRTPFPNNQVPSNRFDPLATKLIGVYASGPGGQLKPNVGAAPGTSAYVRNNYSITSGTQVNPWDKKSIKLDHIFSEKDRLSGYIGVNRIYTRAGGNGPATLPGYYTDYNDAQNLSDVYRMTWDHNFSPTLLNHFYAGGNNWREGHFHPNELLGNWKDKFCLPNVPICNNNLSTVNFSEFNVWGGPSNNGSENTVFSFNDDVNWIKGKHSFKAGGMYQRNHYNGFGQQWDAGYSNFSFTATGVPNDSNFATAGGNSFASFLLGRTNDQQIHTVRFISQQWPYFAGYFQDDYRLNNKLTINVGIRWETQLPPVEANDKWSDFSPTTPNPGAGGIKGALLYAGTGEGRQGTRTLADSYFRAFGPRIGAAYSLNEKTVIRANYSHSYGAITTVTGSTHQLGFTLTSSFNGDGLNPISRFQDGPPAYQLPPFISPSFANRQGIPWWQGQEATRPPANDAWTFSIQRQLTTSLLVEGTYNALIGSQLQANLLSYNQVPFSAFQKYGRALLTSQFDSPAAVAAGIPSPFPQFKALWGNQATVAQALRPFPQYDSIVTNSGGGDHSGHSSYHAGIIRLEKRYSDGLTFQTSYVFSKLITDADSYWSTDFPAAEDHFNRRLEKSIGAYDITHNFKVGFVYDLPFGKGKKWLTSGIADKVVGNWRLSTTHFYSTGLPVTIGSGVSFPIFNGRNAAQVPGYDGWRGNQVTGNFDPQTDNFFQPKSFFGPQSQTQEGNMTRYNPRLRQMGNYSENISVAKGFQITERFKLDFRAEAFNMFNRVRFGTGPTSLSDPNFGRILGNGDLLNDPRRMQMALKLYF